MALNKHVINAADKTSEDVPLTVQEEADKLATEQAYANDTPAREDAERKTISGADLGTALNKTLRDLLLDIEQRLRAAGQNSNIQDIANAGNKNEYLQALRKIHESYQ